MIVKSGFLLILIWKLNVFVLAGMYARTIGDLVNGEIVRSFESTERHAVERTYEITHQNLIEAVIDNKTGNKNSNTQHANNENYKFDNSNFKSKISRIMTEMEGEGSRTVYSPISRPNSTETNSASSQPPPPSHSPQFEGLAYPRAKSPNTHRPMQAAPPTCALPTVQPPRAECIESFFMEKQPSMMSSMKNNMTRSSTIVPVPPNNAGPSEENMPEGLAASLARFAKTPDTKLKEEFNHLKQNDCLLKREVASSTTVVKMERAATPEDPTTSDQPPSRLVARKRSSSTAPSSPPSKMPSNESQDSSIRLNHAHHGAEPPLPPLPPPPPPNSSAPPLPTPPQANGEEDGELIILLTFYHALSMGVRYALTRTISVV